MLQTAAQQHINILSKVQNFRNGDLRLGTLPPMRAPNWLQSIIDRPRPAEMPEEALCLVIVNKAKILEIDYTVTITFNCSK